MHPRTLALILAAGIIGAGCANKETKPDATPTTAATAPTAEATPVASKPECPPEPSAKVKSSKSKNKKQAAPVVVDCEPAKPKGAATSTKASPTAAATPTAAPAATTSAKEPAKATEAGKPRMIKSVDGTFEGEVYGNIPANSKWAKLQIGMEQPQVERILGGSSMEVRTHPTGKAFIPFYFGTDRYRYEVVYRGQGSVSYTGGSWGAGAGILMMINYDPNI